MIFIVTGEKDAGKSTYTHSLVSAIQNKGFVVRGFLSAATRNSGLRKRFDLFDLTSLNSWPLAGPEMKPGYISCGHYFFNPNTIERGEAIVKDAIHDKADLVVMDEIGKCELEGKIWDLSLRNVLASSCSLMMVTARKNHEKVISFYKLKDLFNN